MPQLTNQLVQQYGFQDVQEFHAMVARVDLSSAAKLEAFRHWQRKDGTKAGLQELLAPPTPSQPIPKSVEEVFRKTFQELPQKLALLREYLRTITRDQSILDMRQKTQTDLENARGVWPQMVKVYEATLEVMDEEIAARGLNPCEVKH